ncbi:MAG TPA: hypothetical protein VNU95_01535, partial [Candidatus Acidoferrales bacterium]|nr:hypothetical protein [Candidatus Acidoferrales bacterium]
MIVFQSSASVAAVCDRRLCALCASVANLNSKLRTQHSKLPKPLQSRCDQGYLRLIKHNQAFLGPPPPSPFLSNMEIA